MTKQILLGGLEFGPKRTRYGKKKMAGFPEPSYIRNIQFFPIWFQISSNWCELLLFYKTG